MSWMEKIVEKKSWEHEHRRAIYFGKPFYQELCKAQIDDIELFSHELVGIVCDCNECQSNVFQNGN